MLLRLYPPSREPRCSQPASLYSWSPRSRHRRRTRITSAPNHSANPPGPPRRPRPLTTENRQVFPCIAKGVALHCGWFPTETSFPFSTLRPESWEPEARTRAGFLYSLLSLPSASARTTTPGDDKRQKGRAGHSRTAEVSGRGRTPRGPPQRHIEVGSDPIRARLGPAARESGKPGFPPARARGHRARRKPPTSHNPHVQHQLRRNARSPPVPFPRLNMCHLGS